MRDAEKPVRIKHDRIEVDGVVVAKPQFIYLAMNKHGSSAAADSAEREEPPEPLALDQKLFIADSQTHIFWRREGHVNTSERGWWFLNQLDTFYKGAAGPNSSVSSVVFSPSGKLLATANQDGTTSLWSITAIASHS